MDKDLMWRTAIGGLKTGSFIRRYNILGAELGCKFCSDPLETCQHLILECPGLKVYRDKVIESAGELGCTIRQPSFLQEDREMVLKFGLCPMLESKGVTRNVFLLVAKSFRALWLMRNEAHFGSGRGIPVD